MEDFLLIMQMKQGDEAACEKFVRKYYPEILKYCGYHSFDKGSAEDLTQETFFRFFGSLSTYQHRGKAKNYLYTIAGNLCKDAGKKKLPALIPDEILEQEQAKDAMDETENRLDMEQALSGLSAELREVIILYYFQELKLKENAEVLEIGLPLVKYRLKRGKEVLRELFGKEEGHGIGEKA